MERAVRAAVRLRLAAEVEVKPDRVTKGPSAIVRFKARDRLALAERDSQVIGPERCRQAIILFHGVA